jgi:hypothetical protein
MEDEIERLQRAVAMRDRVIRKLHDDIEEKDAVSYLLIILAYLWSNFLILKLRLYEHYRMNWCQIG